MISDWLEGIARARPSDQVALIDGELRLTYPRLLELRNRFRHFLAHDRGIRGGDLVGLSTSNGWEFVAGFLALADLGSVAVPLSTHYRRHEIQEIVRRISPVSVILGQEQHDAWLDAGYPADRLILDGALRPLLDSDEASERPSLSAASRLQPGDPQRCTQLSSPDENCVAVMLLTSGSTGSPKIVPRSHRNLISGARHVGQALGELAGRRFLGLVPFFHANGFANGMLLSLLNGGTLILARRFYPVAALHSVREHNIDVLVGSPYIYKAWNDLRAKSRGALAPVGICLSSGSAMTSELTRQCEEHLGARIRQLYGSTETGTIAIETTDSSPGWTTAGRPVPGVTVRLGEQAGNQGQPRAAGEIQVLSDAMMTGYLGEPGLNCEIFADGYLRTGDLGYFDSQGNLLLAGRLKNFINLYGIKVDPAEIEQVIGVLPQVIDCAVTGVKSGATEIIKATVAVQPGASTARESIVEQCRRQLAEYKIPRIIEIVEGPLLDISGKRRFGGANQNE